jgi:hypothetical protein
MIFFYIQPLSFQKLGYDKITTLEVKNAGARYI